MDEDYSPSNREKSKRTGTTKHFCWGCEGFLNKVTIKNGCSKCSRKNFKTAFKQDGYQKPKYNAI